MFARLFLTGSLVLGLAGTGVAQTPPVSTTPSSPVTAYYFILFYRGTAQQFGPFANKASCDSINAVTNQYYKQPQSLYFLFFNYC
jgi:hypothetical protein